MDYSKIAGLVDINEVKDVKSARSGIADQLGLSLSNLNKELAEIEAIYAVGDHCRTLAFALSDGAIPSNVGGGYNVRTLIRRLYTINDQFSFELDLDEIISRSALYLSQSFPRVKDARDYVGTIIDIERKRYDKTIEKGRKHVSKLFKSNKTINDNTLVELYSSRGIPPETIAEIALEYKIKIEVPLDFYALVDQNRPQVEIAEKRDDEVDLEKIKSYDTIMLYYDSKPKKIAEAVVEEILDSGHVILDETIFYPVGGGQAEDHGWMHVGKDKLEIIDCQKFGTAIIHKLNRIPEGLKKGIKVKLELDWERRLALMRHHTAVHIVGGAAREVLGQHVWQAGADKTPDHGRLDIVHWESVSRETLDEIEYIANTVVIENKKIKKHVMSRNKAENKFGFTIYQGGVVPGKDLRIIEIPGIDVEACGGTHANQTGDIGYIRIIGAERIQDGVVRITLTAGKKAVERIQNDYSLLLESATAFSVTPQELPMTSQRFFKEWKEQNKKIDKLRKQLAESKIPGLISNAKELKTKSGKIIRIVITKLDAAQSDLIILGEKFSQFSDAEADLIAIIIGKFEERAMVVASRTKGSKYNLSKVIRGIGSILGGGGGGKGDVVAGGGTKVEKIHQALKKAEQIIIESL